MFVSFLTKLKMRLLTDGDVVGVHLINQISLFHQLS